MSTAHDHPGVARPRGMIRSPQNFAGGVLLVALCALALWLTRGLSQGTLRAMGPAMLPDWLAYGVGLSGVALIALGLMRDGEGLERWSLRGPLLVLAAILAFAVTIRPFAIGGLASPGLGMAVAGPLAILIGGFATPEARLRELLVLALSLTPFCMVLFGDLLNLPIPVFPQSLTGLFPAEWSQKHVLRVTAGLMFAAAVLVGLAGRWRRSARIDVADHSGRI